MDQELKVKISVDDKSGALKVTKTNFEGVDKSAKSAAQGITKYKSIVATLAHTSQAFTGIKGAFDYINNAIGGTIKAGIQYNAALEQTQLALKATIASYVDAATMGAQKSNQPCKNTVGTGVQR